MTMGDRIRDLRGDMLQAELAEKLGVSAANVSGWETDLWGPKRPAIVRLASVLGTSVEYLITGSGPKRPEQPTAVPTVDPEHCSDCTQTAKEAKP